MYSTESRSVKVYTFIRNLQIQKRKSSTDWDLPCPLPFISVVSAMSLHAGMCDESQIYVTSGVHPHTILREGCV